MGAKKLDFDSIYFDLFELSSGIYAAISAEKLPSSNAGFFDLGNYSVIFDTLMDPFATRDLIKASKQFTGKEPSFLIISHHHLDHLFGIRLFSKNVPIICSKETYMEAEETIKTRFEDFKERAPEELKRTEELLKDEEDPNKIQELKNDIITWNEIKDPEFELKLPNVIVKDSFSVKGNENQVKIVYIGASHSKGDMVALFENEKIGFMGDILFEKTDPSWATAEQGVPRPPDPVHLRDTLLEYAEKDIEVYVPGHGNLCTKKEMRENAEFYNEYYIKNK